MYRIHIALAELNKLMPDTEVELQQCDRRAINAYDLLRHVAEYSLLSCEDTHVIRQLGERLYLFFVNRGFSNTDDVRLYLNRISG